MLRFNLIQCNGQILSECLLVKDINGRIPMKIPIL
jgi:hypothetical protein